MSHDPDLPWFHEGLRFECHRCGRCCRGAGNVWVTDEEIAALAQLVSTPIDVFRKELVRSKPPGRVLGQKLNRDCVFWDEASGCQVYSARPRQCRTYPFWQANLGSEADWDSEKRECPGVGEGPLRGREEIESLAADDGIPAHRTRLRTL